MFELSLHTILSSMTFINMAQSLNGIQQNDTHTNECQHNNTQQLNDIYHNGPLNNGIQQNYTHHNECQHNQWNLVNRISVEYCEQTSKWNNNDANWNSLSVIMLKGLQGIFISNGKKGKESKTTERQRERECVREVEHCG